LGKEKRESVGGLETQNGDSAQARETLAGDGGGSRIGVCWWGYSCKSGGEPPHSRRDSRKRKRSGGEEMAAGVGEGLAPEGVSYRMDWDGEK